MALQWRMRERAAARAGHSGSFCSHPVLPSGGATVASPPGSSMAIDYEPFSARERGDPYPAYRELRDRAPVHFAPESRCWCVSRHEDALQVLNRPEDFSSRAMFTVLMNAGYDGPPPLSWRMGPRCRRVMRW